MEFRFDVKALSGNPVVYRVENYKLTLCTDFKIELFQLWKSGDPEAVQKALDSHGLGAGATGKDFFPDLVQSFKSSGYPNYRNAELELKTDFKESNPLVLSGKFRRNEGRQRNGIHIDPGFEKELFEKYPEMSIEDALAQAGIDPVDVGYQKIRKIRLDLEERAREFDQCEEDGAQDLKTNRLGESRETVDNPLTHPYIADVRDGLIVFKDAFYSEICLIPSANLSDILTAYELPAGWFSERNRMIIRSKQSRWEGKPGEVIEWSNQVLRIQRNRSRLMARSVADGFEAIRRELPSADIESRRRLCRHISELPEDPWGFYTTKRILEKIGMPKSVYYELLNNEDYGMSRERRAAQDEKDIILVREVLDYKGFAKGVRQIYMLMPRVTGQQFSVYRIRRLMKKYGIQTKIRRPSRNRKAMKELIERNRKSNLLLRRFRLHRPNEVRLTDVTYLDYGDGLRAYGSASIDPATGRLICFVVSERNDLQLALDTLKALDRYPAKNGAVLHSDQGILYLTDEFQAAVVERALDQSMSRRGNCWDNAPQEAFFGHFKDECGYEKCRSVDELRDRVQEYAVYYNEERGIWERGRMTPVEYEAWLNAMTEEEFRNYLAVEEEKYRRQKEESAEKAVRRAREYRENTLAALKERRTDETG